MSGIIYLCIDFLSYLAALFCIGNVIPCNMAALFCTVRAIRSNLAALLLGGLLQSCNKNSHKINYVASNLDLLIWWFEA